MHTPTHLLNQEVRDKVHFTAITSKVRTMIPDKIHCYVIIDDLRQTYNNNCWINTTTEGTVCDYHYER